VKAGGNLGCSDYAMVEFRIQHRGRKATNRITTLGFRRANSGLFNDTHGGILWVRILEGRVVQKSRSLFRHHFLSAQDQCTSISRKSSKGGRRPAWMRKEILAELIQKRKIYGMWKEGQATWEECRNVVRACRDAMRKAKAHLELKLARDIKDNKRSFFKYVGSKQRTRENVGPLLNEVGALVMKDAGKAEFLNAFFASVFTAEGDC